jgi:hypothetical protein
MDNVRWIWNLNEAAWNGPNPPSPPKVTAYEEDSKVTIVWDALTSEKSLDNISGEKDFEGYKVYRSSDHGKNWGGKITNARGEFIGYEPIVQFDLKNDIKGIDPVSNLYLGSDSGIQHTFIDTTVINGIEYWYTVTAYDKGESGILESLESALGLSVAEVNVASARPATLPVNFNAGVVLVEDNFLTPDSGFTDGKVIIDIIDPKQLKNRNYKITFQENTPIVERSNVIDSVTTFTLKDTYSGEILLLNRELTDKSGDNLPVIDGFRLSLIDSEPGIHSLGWTKVTQDSCTFDWYTEKRTNSFQEVDEEVFGYEDFKIIVVDTSEGSLVPLTDGVFEHEIHSYIKIPIRVYIITDPNNPIDVSEYTEVFDLRVAFPTSSLLGPLGWDLIPGGAGYNSSGGATFWPDILALNAGSDETSAHIWIKTQNGPDTAIPPSVGDEFTVKVTKPFNEKVVYTFSTTASNYIEVDKSDLKNIRVVPNPYFVTSSLNNRIMFINLPNQCEIKIFNVAGDLIRKLYNKGDSGVEFWDLKNDQGLAVAYGLYVYVIKADNGEIYIGKCSIIR